jgi:hypothetical protein
MLASARVLWMRLSWLEDVNFERDRRALI